jgi:hypothetical protein
MPRSDETFIVRVRGEDGDAVVEQPRVSRRRRVRHVADVGAVIASWLGSGVGEPNAQRTANDASAEISGSERERRAP